MKAHLLTERSSSDNQAPVSRKRMRERAVELAQSEGRLPQDASKADWEQAKRDLMSEPSMGSNGDLHTGDDFAPATTLLSIPRFDVSALSTIKGGSTPHI